MWWIMVNLGCNTGSKRIYILQSPHIRNMGMP